MNTFAVVFFAGEAVLNCFGNLGIHGSAIGGFDFGRFSALYVFIIGGVIYGLLCLVNYFVSKAMCRFSDIMGAIKFLPMLMVILLGVIFGIMNGGGL
ncbi:MAG: hypothetical protein MJ219_02060 [Mycoplasmoidaceae bacterium]|nr:hypothetical protein [Mycoplasmoidaceae bacterium]